LRFGSLFSGIGGLDLGLEMAGMECSWMVEVDKFGSQILKHHWPEAEIYGDIYKIDGKELEPVDLICGGFPCQPVSLAGKRGGTSDERWLWGEFARIIRQVKPRWVVAENVTGLLSANSGRAFAEVLRDLAESGYDAVWNVFPAGGPGGVGAPHQRQRIFIIGKYVENSNSRGRRREKRIGKDDLSRSKGEEPNSIIDEASKGCRTWNIESSDVTNSNDKRVGRGKRCALEKDRGNSNRVHSEVANTDREGSPTPLQRSSRSSGQQESTSKVSRKSNAVANSKRIRQQRQRTSRKWSSSETYGERQTDNAFTVGIDNQWSVEPNVGRVAYGVPNRVDRLKALGNAVVPQVAKQIGEMIMEIESV